MKRLECTRTDGVDVGRDAALHLGGRVERGEHGPGHESGALVEQLVVDVGQEQGVEGGDEVAGGRVGAREPTARAVALRTHCTPPRAQL